MVVEGLFSGKAKNGRGKKKAASTTIIINCNQEGAIPTHEAEVVERVIFKYRRGRFGRIFLLSFLVV